MGTRVRRLITVIGGECASIAALNDAWGEECALYEFRVDMLIVRYIGLKVWSMTIALRCLTARI